MPDWGFLTKHARALVCIAHDPGVRLRDLAVELDVTERSAFGIVEDLINGGYVAKEREGRRNRYHIQVDAPLGEAIGRQETIGELLKLLIGSKRGARQIQRK